MYDKKPSALNCDQVAEPMQIWTILYIWILSQVKSNILESEKSA